MMMTMIVIGSNDDDDDDNDDDGDVDDYANDDEQRYIFKAQCIFFTYQRDLYCSSIACSCLNSNVFLSLFLSRIAAAESGAHYQ